MADDLVKRAHWGDLSGQNWAGLVRLSFELDAEQPEHTEESDAETARPRFVPMTGRDLRGREEQDKDCMRFVESRGGRYVYTYEEPDTSAWKRKRVRLPDGTTVYRVIRPVFEGALEDLKNHRAPNGERLDGLIVYDIDRLTRDPRHLEDAIEVVENFGRPIMDITGTLDLLTDNGRTVARIVVATSHKQSADTARRVRRKHEALQQAGIPTGGRRPFGWQADKRTADPAEAELLREAVQRLLAGAPVATIVADWNHRGIKTASGRTWMHDTLKIVLRNPRICGYRSRYVSDFHPVTGAENKRVEMVFNDKGEPVKGKFDAIISVEEWEAVVEIIGTSPRATGGMNARKYLLSGIIRCGKGECHSPLRGTKSGLQGQKPEGFFYYTCPSKGTGKGCGGIKISGPETDALIVKAVIAKYEQEARDREATQTPAQWSDEAELARVREDIDDLKQARKARQVSAARYFSLLAEAEAEERQLLADRNRWVRDTYAVQAKQVDLRRDWQGLTLAEQRAYVEDALITVVALPSPRRGTPLRERVKPLFRD